MAGPTILLVEDEVLIAQDEMRLLERLGYSVCKHVIHGDDAIAAAETYQPDLVLMDIYLPGETDGVDAAIAIGQRWGIPVVFATAYSDDETLGRAEVARPLGYVLKPFQQKQLQVTLKSALNRAGDHDPRPSAATASGAASGADALSLLFDTADDAVLLLEGDVIRRANDPACALFGVENGEVLLGRPLATFFTESQRSGLSPDLLVLEHLARVKESGVERFGARGRRRSGELLELQVVLRRPAGFGETRTIAIIRNVSHEISLEDENRIVFEILHGINRATGARSMVRDLTGSLQRWLHVEAVGVRLEDEGDFPYYEVRGFPARFVQMENSLCCRDLRGQLIRDESGNPVLECMCGNVIRGRTDPSLPFFTPAGSFWTNSTTDLLASTSEEDRQARTRNRCNGEGYESVALVPLSAGGRTIGLIQLNDHRRDMFTLARIEQIERIACDCATAIERFWLASEMEAIADDRERLVLEMHHRVNTNLQVLMSVLNTQLAHTKDGSDAAMRLGSARNRVAAIAHVQQALFDNTDRTCLDVLSFLQELELFQRSSSEDNRGEIKTRLSIESGMAIPGSMAVPVGLALNELIANAFAYAFPGGRRGAIAVHGRRRDDRIEIEIIDDGVADARECVPAGEGLPLVRALIEDQLGGTVTVDDGAAGNAIRIEMPVRSDWENSSGEVDCRDR